MTPSFCSPRTQGTRYALTRRNDDKTINDIEIVRGLRAAPQETTNFDAAHVQYTHFKGLAEFYQDEMVKWSDEARYQRAKKGKKGDKSAEQSERRARQSQRELNDMVKDANKWRGKMEEYSQTH